MSHQPAKPAEKVVTKRIAEPPRGAAVQARPLLACYAALWLATAAAAALGAAGARLAPSNGPPHDALAPTLRTTLALLGHNVPIALWPLALVALDWPRLSVSRALGDALIAGHLLSHALIVGATIGEQPETWHYLPHLPLEWLALAIPAASWWTARKPAAPRRSLAALALAAAGVLAALSGAAAIETYLVPIN